MPKRINASQIKPEFDSVIAHAANTEPQLADRLRQLSRWVKGTKPGSLTKKKFVLGLLVEVLQDAKTWLKVKDMDDEEKQAYYYEAELTPPELYWYETLFPLWFRISDPKLSIWTKKLMAEEFSSSDGADIVGFVGELEDIGASVFYRYILDLSMSTDILVSGSCNKPLAVQLTKTNPQLLSEKQNEWNRTLIYWSIKRGVLFSQSPSHPIRESAKSLVRHSDSLSDGCYVVDTSKEN
jgi:hypothetical protein